MTTCLYFKKFEKELCTSKDCRTFFNKKISSENFQFLNIKLNSVETKGQNFVTFKNFLHPPPRCINCLLFS
jgi:hypothetical protein